MISVDDIDIKKIAVERINQGISSSELSKKAGLGKNTVNNIEKRIVTPRSHTLGKIAKALGKKIEDFMVG
ncbi:XRE family transcriptional regulator [Brevibacillus laterosporus]|uniref:helix-turn-helix domain-containing protein n=1 Tax=Brevibacillus laterosporus TaxID=1465 RepID=UPI002405561A|nr:helix-turn-helix transcriptional regulator [Brevibacillus laterosporus]MDF9412959.1 XRE family transcriptional regulator [Brevibacillus laterosporus]